MLDQMERQLEIEAWCDAILQFAEQEQKRYRIPMKRAEQMCRDIVRFVEYTHIKQYKLFQQQRGEEFEKVLGQLRETGYDEESIQRFFANEELWTMTLNIGER